MANKKKGSRVTPKKAERCRVRTSYCRQPMPHKFSSSETKTAPDGTVLSKRTFCSGCGKDEKK